jgi:hypothetical protein
MDTGLYTAQEIMGMSFTPRLPVALADGFVCITDPETGFSYDFPMSRIETKEDLLCWVRHISDKSWCTAEAIRDLIDLVIVSKNWKITEA